ncbi:MAG: hypothetical protein FGM58_08540 [Acidimicrobiia bacterium]|nr:hypothetical protein [Acidimicrobiia bacterium]
MSYGDRVLSSRSKTLALLAAAFAAAALGLAACGDGDGSASARRAAADGGTPYIDAVATAIRQMEQSTGSDTSEGVLWEVTTGNSLPGAGTGDPRFLARTSECWGRTQGCDSSGVQQRLVDQIRRIVASGETLVDVSSLSAIADGGFRQALIDGAADGAQAGRAPTIRLLWGRSPATPFSDGVLERLQADVQAANPRATVVAALMTNTPLFNGYSWNHSKIVAADSSVALAMGINLWSRSYLQSDNPITDVGVEVDGPAAANAQRFLDVLWRFSCANTGFNFSYNITIVPKDGGPGGCPGTRAPDPGPARGGTTVLAVGRAGYIADGRVTGRNADSVRIDSADRKDSGCNLPPLPNPMNGDAVWDGNNPSDTALRALVATAQRKVVISQQDLIFPCAIDPSYDVRLVDALVGKVAAGVPVTVVVSNEGAAANLSEQYGGNPRVTRDLLMRRLTKLVGSPQRAAELACANLVVAPFRFSDAATWPNGKSPGHHAKVIAVDDAAFYVGSQNAYPNQLQEFGWIIEDPAAVADFRSAYLDPMVEYSTKAAVPCR